MSMTALSVPPIEREDVHEFDDDRFHPGRVCVVTGGASGIGRAVVLAAAVNGLTVLATDVDEAGLAETIEHAERLAVADRVETVAADLEDDAALEAITDAARERGNVSYLANVAGLQHVAPLESFPLSAYDRIQRVMLRAPFVLTRHLWEDLEANDGCVGNMASVHGHYVTSDKVAYNTVKFGIRGLTQSIAAEGDGDVRAFSVSTGYVKTPLVTEQIPETAAQRGLEVDEVIEDVMLGQARTGEMMTPLEVANLFLFGFSGLASHLNGGDLLFDDGMTLTYE
ncbi:SDR family NAD(P)-dependent oxidoreductase [Natronosalvus rutilus]|uniref:SDR family oxidoreductase n=1 Tax=Natronosalvus rutilus TaxID=2953753 RepID=A0A9E7SWF9_9EURY|nr:SDR family NAD(P)-dependent oxidoreductase [Natronosalvus rutilus]UTF55465.1 SDR family oxidoreductase [Natronosalvus rutilus]